MESSTAKSNQRILSVILILLSIPILYSVGRTIFFYQAEVNEKSFFNIRNVWFIIQQAIYIVLLVLLAMQKYGILLVHIGIYAGKCLRFLFYFNEYLQDHSWEFWIFNALNFICLILLIVLLKREGNRYFNLKFGSKITGYEKTYRFTIAICIAYLGLRLLELAYAFSQFNVSVIDLLNPDIILLLVVLVTTIIGIVNKSKIINLSLALILASLLNIFLSSGYSLLVPFTESWSGWGIYPAIFGLAYDAGFILFGILIFYLLRNYFREKRLTADFNISDSEILDA